MKAIHLGQNLALELKPLYVTSGEDFFLQNLAIDNFKGLIEEDARDFGLVIFDGVDDVRNIIDACNTPPFMTERKVVIVKNLTAKQADALKPSLEKYLQNPADYCILNLVDNDDCLKNIKKLGEIVDCSKEDARYVGEWIKSTITSKGYKIAESAVKRIMEYTALDMARVNEELGKLFAYCADNKVITDEDVQALVPPDTEFQVFKLTNAIEDGNNAEVFRCLNVLLERGEEPLKILALLTTQYRMALHVNLNANRPKAELAQMLGCKIGVISYATRRGAAYDQMSLKRLVDKLVDLEYKFKSRGGMSDIETIEYAVAYLMKKEK